jgi:hypothetical protein
VFSFRTTVIISFLQKRLVLSKGFAAFWSLYFKRMEMMFFLGCICVETEASCSKVYGLVDREDCFVDDCGFVIFFYHL